MDIVFSCKKCDEADSNLHELDYPEEHEVWEVINTIETR